MTTLSADTRIKVLRKYNAHCAYCGRKLTLETMTVDHLMPQCVRKIDAITNLMPACEGCNFIKGSDISLTALRLFLLLPKMSLESLTDPHAVKAAIEKQRFYFESYHEQTEADTRDNYIVKAYVGKPGVLSFYINYVTDATEKQIWVPITKQQYKVLADDNQK